MKGDAQLRQDVMNELMWDPSISEKAIGVAAENGVVTLAGFVDSNAQKSNAERAAARVSGVRGLVDQLSVIIPSGMARSDAQIAQAVVKALEWDIEVPSEWIHVKVERGRITLEGSVPWQFQKSAAERAVRFLTGVRGVSNLIVVQPKQVSPFEVSQKIKDALRRSAEEDADHVIVETSEGKVTLTGSVKSLVARSEAERAAWSAPGVSNVKDEILVGV
jgi:osmotically-inducible protein OsmY